MSENIRKLNEAVDNNKLVIFVGAGISANSELPDWKELIEVYREALGMDKSKPISSDEYLKIPQYYYNMRGFKDYYDIINRVFNKNYEPNKIHELIFRLSPQHIVTTNYDNLIEQEMERQGLLYDVVCEDKDLPYTPNGKLLIKMHGDLQKKNIVLKEDDYLSYDENFRLIETFVKALFVNHTVVFIGYSLGDYDLKLIINNVKNILGKHFQKGYIINSSDRAKDSYEENYFYNMGFNVIDINAIPKDYECSDYGFIKNNHGKNLVKILNYIEHYKDEPHDILELYYKKLQIFRDLNFIHTSDLLEILENQYRSNYDGSIDIYGYRSKEFIQKLIQIDEAMRDENKKDTLTDKDKERFKYISKTFLKSNVKNISLPKTSISVEKSEEISYSFNTIYEDKSEILEKILTMDYKSIDLIAQQQYKSFNIHNSKYFNSLFKAYCNYLTKRYVSAFKILKEISRDSYRDNDYLSCYISEYNKSNIIKILRRIVRSSGMHPFIPNGLGETVFAEEIHMLIKEYESSTLNMDIIYSALSKKEKQSIGNMRLLRFDNNFIHERLNRIRELKEQVFKDNKSIHAGNPNITAVNKIKDEVKGFWYNTNKNYLTITHYSEISEYYKIYIYSLFSTYTKNKPDPMIHSIFPGMGYKTREHDFDLMDINVVITFITAKDLVEFITEFEVNTINIDKSVDVILILQNIIDSYEKSEYNTYIREFLSAYLVFIAHLNLEYKQVRNVIPLLSKILNTKAIDSKTYYYIDYFIYQQSKLGGNKYKYIIDNAIRHLLSMFMKKLLNTEFNNLNGGFELNALSQENFIELLLQNLKIKTNVIKDKSLLNCLINSIKYGTLSKYKHLLITKFLIPVYKSVSIDQKAIIANLINEELNQAFNSKLYSSSCINRIISPNKNMEAKLWNEVDIEIKNKNDFSKSFPDPLESELSDISDLLFNKMVLDMNKAGVYVGYFDIYDLLIDINNFDYKNKFNLEWLSRLNHKVLEDISHIQWAKVQIRNKAIPALIDNTLNKKQVRVFFKYFN
jgi:NAD-dependent SIR2 family protein deacetylase